MNQMLKDIREEDSNGNNYGSYHCYTGICFYEFGGRLWFKADDGTHGDELWYTEGTAITTFMFADIREEDSNGNNYGSYPEFIFMTEDYFYFIAHDGDSQRLFMTDGKQMIMDLDVHSSDVYISGTPVMFDGEFYMSLRTQPTGYELWKSDGTSEGTVMVHEFWSGTNGGNPQNLMVVNNNLLFMIAYPGDSALYYHNLFAYAVEDYEI